MIATLKTKIIFKTIVGVVVFSFLWQQILWAGDLIDAALDRQYREQSQTFAPDYLQNQEAMHQSMIATKQALEDGIQPVSLAAELSKPVEELTPELKGPKTASSSRTIASAPSTILEEGEAAPEPDGAILSVTTEAGDIISYNNGSISHIRKKDGTILRNIKLGPDNDLLGAEILYTDGTVQTVNNGKTARITKPDGTILNYSDDETLLSISYSDGKTTAFTYIRDDKGSATETILTDPDKISHYGSDNKLKRVEFNTGRKVEYENGVLSKITETDTGVFIFDIKADPDGGVTSSINRYRAANGNVYSYVKDENGSLKSVTIEKDGAVASYDRDGSLMGVTKNGQPITSEAIAEAQADYDEAFAIYREKKQYTEDCRSGLDNADKYLADRVAAKDAAAADLNAAIQTLNIVQTVKDAKEALHAASYNDYAAAQATFDMANTSLNNAKALEAQVVLVLLSANNALADKENILNAKTAARRSLQFAIDNLNSEVQADQASLAQAQQNLNLALIDESAARSDCDAVQADVDLKTAAHDNAARDVLAKEIALGASLADLEAARQAKAAAESALSNWDPNNLSFYERSPWSVIFSQYKRLRNCKFFMFRVIARILLRRLQTLARFQFVRNIEDAADKLNIAQFVYDSANTALNNAKLSEARSAEVLLAANDVLTDRQGALSAKVSSRQAIQAAITDISDRIQSDQAKLTEARNNLNRGISEESAAQSDYDKTKVDVSVKQSAYNSALQDRQVREAALNTAASDLAGRAGIKDQAYQSLEAAVRNLDNARIAKDAKQAAYDTAHIEYIAALAAREQALAAFNSALGEESVAKEYADPLSAALNTLLHISSMFPREDEVLQNANRKLDAVSILYDPEKRIKQVYGINGDIQADTDNDGLIDNIANSLGATLYSYDLSALGNINEMTVDRDGIKRIYDKYGNIKSLSLDDATKIVYENGQVKEIQKSDGTKIKNVTFRESGELDSALVSYPDGSVAVYDDSKLLRLISASGDTADYIDGKIRKVTLDDGTAYDWFYENNNIIILDEVKQEKRTYFEGRLLQVEESAGAKLITKYYYDEISKNLARSEICQGKDILYIYTYTYENGLTLIHDEDGNTQAYTKDKRLAYLIDSKGKKYSYTYVGKNEGRIEVYFPSGSRARYDLQGNLIDITQADGVVIKDISFDAGNAPRNFIYIKDDTTYRVVEGKIKEVLSKDGTDTMYYDNGFVKSIGTQAGGLTEYQYFVKDNKIFNGVPQSLNGSLSQLSFYNSDGVTRLRLSKNPLEFGTGLDGAKHVSANETLPAGVYNFESLTIEPGKTLTISPNATMKVLGTVTVNGAIFCGGSFSICANDVNIGASGSITGAVNIRCNTINNAGMITGNTCMTGTLGNGANELDRDDNFNTDAHYFCYNPGGTSLSPRITFPSCAISSVKWRAGGDGSGNSQGYGILYLYINGVKTQVSPTYQWGRCPGSFDTGVLTINGSWNNVTGIEYYIESDSSIGVARAYGYEMQAIIGTPTIEYVSGNPGPANTTASRPIASIKQPEYPSLGTFESDVIELNALEPGSISWNQDVPQGTGITFQTRTGNTATPDSMWSGWSAGLTGGNHSQITSPKGKYIQYKINLSTVNSAVTPILKLGVNSSITFDYSRAPGGADELSVIDHFTASQNGVTNAYDNKGLLSTVLSGLVLDTSYLDRIKGSIPDYVLNDTQKQVYLKDNIIISELTAIKSVNETITEYCQGQISKIIRPDKTVISNIIFNDDNSLKGFTYIKDGVKYIVENGTIKEAKLANGTDISYYSSTFVSSIKDINNNIKEYEYGISDVKDISISSALGTSQDVSFRASDITKYLTLNRPALDLGTGSDGDLRVEAGQSLTIDGTRNYRSIYVARGATLTVSPWNGSNGGELLLKCAGSVVIEGSINIGAKGYNRGPGIGNDGAFQVGGIPGYYIRRTSGAGGGSYGTVGQYGSGINVSTGSAPGSCYGDVASGALFMGSGGGTAYNGTAGGVGGGKIKILANSINISGNISSNGGDGGAFAGGGSGGSVWLMAGDMSINGSISVRGGSGGSYGASGGNGIIRIDYSTLTGNIPAGAYTRQLEYTTIGTFMSEVIEVNATALNKVSWSQSLPQNANTQVALQTRTGNTSDPDTTWSDWSAAMRDSSGTQAASPAGKYIQYKFTLSTQTPTASPSIAFTSTSGVHIGYARDPKSSADLSNLSYIKVKSGAGTVTYNRDGVNIANPTDTINVSGHVFDSTYLETLTKDIPNYKLSDAQKVTTIYDKGNDIPVEIINADQSITYFDKGYAARVVDKNGVLQVQYIYDADNNILKTEFVDARRKLQDNYQKAVSEIVTQKDAALAKLAASEASARAGIDIKSADIQKQINNERQRLALEKGMYDPGVYDLSEFGRAFAELDDYEAGLHAQTQSAYADLANQVTAAKVRINADVNTAMQALIDNDYNKILADIVQKESSPIIYQYYRKILGRDPGDNELLYWMNIAKAGLKPLTAAEITQYLQNLPEYADRLTRKQNIINNVSAFFSQYLSASDSTKQTMLSSLGLTLDDVTPSLRGAEGTEAISGIISYLNSQSLHFGDSALQTVLAMLKNAGINRSFEDIGKDAIKIDMLTGVITPRTKGDLTISMYAMRKAASLGGLTLYSQKISYNDLKEEVSKGNAIIHIDGKHYVLVTSIDDAKGTVTYTDTTVGQNGQSMTISRAELMGSWKGYALSKELPGDPVKQITVTKEKNIRGSSWWSSFWKGIVNFFQKIAAPVAAVLLMIPPLAPIGAVLLGINIIIQTISFVVRTGTLMDVVWSAVNTIGAAIGAAILPNIYEAAGHIFSAVGSAIFAPLKGVFSSVMPLFNNLSTAVSNIATGIGHILSFGTASADISASIGYNIITQGISVGTDFLFKSMNLDPSLAHMGSALMTGAVMGVLTPNTDIVSEALKYGSIEGVEELGRAVDLDPDVTHLAAIISGSFVNGAVNIRGRELTYNELMRNIAPNIASEAAYIGIDGIGDLLGVDSRISYLAGAGLRSTINAGLDHEFKPDVIWGSVQQGLLQGVTNIGLNFATEELGISPLLANIGFSAISGAINAGIQAATGGSKNVFGTLFKTYTDNALTFLGYADPNSPGYAWQQAAYISQILDFSNIVQERGLVDALNTYGAGFFNAVAVNNIVQSGYTLGGYFANKLNTGQYATRTLQDGKQVKEVLVKDGQGNTVTKVFFQQKQVGETTYWDIVGREDVSSSGSYLGWGELGVDAYGKLGYTDADLYSIFNSDIQYQQIRSGQQAYAEIKDSLGNTLLVIEPTEGGHYNVYDSYGEYADAKINTLLSGKTYSFDDAMLKYYQELDPTNSTSLFDVDFSNPDAIGLMFNNLSLSSSGIANFNFTPAQKQQITYVILGGIDNPCPEGLAAPYMRGFETQLAIADPSGATIRNIAMFPWSGWGNTNSTIDNSVAWICNAYFGSHQLTNDVITGMQMQFGSQMPSNMTGIGYSGGGDPYIQAINENPGWDVKAVVLVNAPLGYNRKITNPNVKNVIMIGGTNDPLAEQGFMNQGFDNNPRPLNVYKIALNGIGHKQFSYDPNEQNPDPKAVQAARFSAEMARYANDKMQLDKFLNRQIKTGAIVYSETLKLYFVNVDKVSYE